MKAITKFIYSIITIHQIYCSKWLVYEKFHLVRLAGVPGNPIGSGYLWDAQSTLQAVDCEKFFKLVVRRIKNQFKTDQITYPINTY